MTMPIKSLEPTAAPLSRLVRLSFRTAGSSGRGSALIGWAASHHARLRFH
jgi:hypothetical protein